MVSCCYKCRFNCSKWRTTDYTYDRNHHIGNLSTTVLNQGYIYKPERQHMSIIKNNEYNEFTEKRQEHKRTRRAMDTACRAQSCDDVIVSPFHQLSCKALKFESNATHASRLNPKQSRRTDGRVGHQTNTY